MEKSHDGITISQNKTPEYKTNPILGIIPDILQRGALTTLLNAMYQHGGFVKLKLGPKPVYLVSEPEILQRMLRDNYKNYRKPELFYNAIEPLVGEGLVRSSGDFWLRQRRMISPHMHRKQLGNLTNVMTEAIDKLLNHWQNIAAKGEDVDIGAYMSHITMDVITRTMFGSDTLNEAEMADVSEALTQALDYASMRAYLPFLPNWMPLPGHGQFNENLRTMRQTVMRLIKQRQADYHERSDLLSMLMSAVDEETNERMTDQQLFDEAMTIFLAGFETTATSLMWLWYVLDSQPQVLAKLREEIAAAVGNRTPQFEDLRNLPYCNKVFKEALRLYPPAPMLPREVIADDQLGNYQVKAGDTLLIFYYGVHRNPEYWKDAETFDPERFTPEQESARHHFAYIPFSEGPRRCVGDDFARLEGVLAMVMMLQRYDVKIEADEPIVPKFGATLRPEQTIFAKLIARN